MSWCRCEQGHDFWCPPYSCEEHEKAALKPEDTNGVGDTLYHVAHLAAVVGGLELASRGLLMPAWSPRDEDYLKSLGVESGSVESVGVVHAEYIRLIEESKSKLREISADVVFGMLPRLLTTAPEIWNDNRGLESE